MGAATMQAQYAPNLTPQEMAKPWSISASLRGFYDDNYLTQPSTFPTGNPPGTGPAYGHPLSSYGIEVSPSAAFNHSTEDTLISLSYLYDLKYYFEHDYTEQAHQANLRFEHRFSDKYKLSVADSFVVAQEPTLIDPAIVSTPLLATGNNIHNTGTVGFDADLSKDFSLHLGYENNLYAYRQVGGDETGFDPVTGAIISAPYSYASRAAALDRIEQLGSLDLRWKVVPDTTALVGYQYGHTDYTSPEAIIYSSPGVAAYNANIRNADEHFGYFGVDHSFTPDFSGSIRGGAEYLDYYNIDKMSAEKLPSGNNMLAKTIVNYVETAKLVVASAVNAEGEPLYPRKWNDEFIGVPIVEKDKQDRQTVTGDEVTNIIARSKGRYRTLFSLLAGSGVRTGEGLALKPEDFSSDCRVIHITHAIWKKNDQRPKTPASVRDIDIPEQLAALVREYLATIPAGHYLFATASGKPMSQRNTLRILHNRKKVGFMPFADSALRFCGKPGYPVIWRSSGSAMLQSRLRTIMPGNCVKICLSDRNGQSAQDLAFRSKPPKLGYRGLPELLQHAIPKLLKMCAIKN